MSRCVKIEHASVRNSLELNDLQSSLRNFCSGVLLVIYRGKVTILFVDKVHGLAMANLSRFF